MKKEAFKIVRRYRKCFARLAIKYPKDSLKYWYILRSIKCIIRLVSI